MVEIKKTEPEDIGLNKMWSTEIPLGKTEKNIIKGREKNVSRTRKDKHAAQAL